MWKLLSDTYQQSKTVSQTADTRDGVRQCSEVIVKEKRVWTSAEVRGWSATRELVGVQSGSNIVPISDAIDGEDGDLYLEEWDGY